MIERETIFDPRGITGMRKTYPELARIKEFEGITEPQLRFIWWYANPTSPLFYERAKGSTAMDSQERCRQAIEKSEIKLAVYEKNEWVDGRFGEKLQIAIDRMSRIDLSSRKKAANMVEKIFQQYEEIIGKGAGEDLTEYMNNTKIILKELPNLVKIKEEGFGVTGMEETRRNASKGQDNIQNYLQSKKEV